MALGLFTEVKGRRERIYFFSSALRARMTALTIFCSSIKKARTMLEDDDAHTRDQTQPISTCWEDTATTTTEGKTGPPREAANRTDHLPHPYRLRTQVAQREPPYARETVRSLLWRRAYWTGRRHGMPLILVPQSPHLGPAAILPTYCTTFLPPGVLILAP